MQVTIDLEDEGLKDLSTMTKEIRRSVLKDATSDMVRFLMMNSPVDHGLLKSWFIEYMTDEESSIKSPAKYALYVDQGTKAHWIAPKNKKALHWTGTGNFYAGGLYHSHGYGGFSKGHMVGGIQGRHFVDKSFNLVKPRMGGYLAKALEGAR